MFSLAVLENKDEKIASSLVRAIKKYMKKNNISVLISHSDKYEFLQGTGTDLLIISPKALLGTAVLGAKKALNSKCILLPGGLLESLRAIESDYVISYGMSPRDTITASSISDDGVVITLQRELVTLRGEVIERQDLPLIPLKKSTPEQIMSERGALLLLGISNECVSTQ